jgi:hypothetical protein
MKRIDIGQAIGIAANVGVIAGIVFLAYELRQNTVATQLVAAQALVDQIGETNRLIAENPEFADLLRRSAVGDELSDTDQLRMRQFFMLAQRSWQNAFYQYRQGALDEGLWEGQLGAIEDILIQNRAAREHWAANQQRFSAEFNEFIGALLREHGLL